MSYSSFGWYISAELQGLGTLVYLLDLRDARAWNRAWGTRLLVGDLWPGSLLFYSVDPKDADHINRVSFPFLPSKVC